jgi:predicted metal-dependent hydrolase
MEFTLRNNPRARRIVVTVRRDGSVIVSKPRWVHARIAEKFVRESEVWIERTRARYAALPKTSRIENSAREFRRLKRHALAHLEQRVRAITRRYGVAYSRVAVRNQKARWGSCSREGVLSFNYRLLFLPQELSDYVVVHEVCHLLELNHSKRFWALVAREVPDHLALRAELRRRERHLLVD